MTGRSVTGTFDGLPQGSIVQVGRTRLVVLYLGHQRDAHARRRRRSAAPCRRCSSLTLGAPASFGAFTPGVAREYSASTTANVISTAGDATLSVSDPSSTATGRLVNGAFSLPQPLQVSGTAAFAPVGGAADPTLLKTWANPVSNDSVAMAFKQAIGASDALRTGTYSKTLTFTLSTTAP